MNQERQTTLLCENADVLGSSGPIGEAVDIRGSGQASVHVTIDDGSGGAPATSVGGKLLIEVSADGEHYAFLNQVWHEPFAKPFDAALIPNQNMNTGAQLVLPGTMMRCRWEHLSGGGGDSRLTVSIVTW